MIPGITSRTENAGDFSAVDRSDVLGSGSSLNFKGFSEYVVEKSVISGSVFASDFSTGHGMQYWRNGEVSRDMEWTNFELQDILPTWQWWVQKAAVDSSAAAGADESLLTLDWDYGPKFYKGEGSTKVTDLGYTKIGAYNGGSSLVIYGGLQGGQLVNLYKTNLNVASGSKLKLTYNKPSNDDSSTMYAAVILVDETDETATETRWLPINNSGKKTSGWTTAEVDLSSLSGRTIAAIGLGFAAAGKVENYQINIGRLEVTDGESHTPAAPTGLKLVDRFDATGEIRVGWDLAEYGDVRNYHLYAVYNNNTERFVGGAFSDNYYIRKLEDVENVKALRLRAVGADGSESQPCELSLASGGAVSNVRTVSSGNKLTVTWEETGSVSNVTVALDYWYSNETNPAPVTVAGGVKSAEISIPVEDGQKYILTVTADNGEPVSYFGQLADTYCAPYSGRVRKMLGLGAGLQVDTPSIHDYSKLYMAMDGKETVYSRFAEAPKLKDIKVPETGTLTMTITLEDTSGNRSEPVSFLIVDGMPASGGEAGDNIIPDPVLRAALAEKVGATFDEMLNFNGPLDLSNTAVKDLTGLSLVPGITALNLAGSAVTEVRGSDLPTNLQEVNLTGCASLTKVNLSERPNVQVTLTGCTNLENLSLAGTALTALNIQGLTRLHNFDISNSQIAELTADASYSNAYCWKWENAKLDLSSTASAGRLKEALVSYFKTATLPPELGDEEVAFTFSGGNTFTKTSDLASSEKVFNLGDVKPLSRITFVNNQLTTSWGADRSLKKATVYVSEDGSNYTEAAKVDNDGTMANVTILLPTGTMAQYIKVVADAEVTRFSTNQWKAYGYGAAPTGFTYSGQQPAMTRDAVAAGTTEADGQQHQMLDLLNASYASAKTVESGTLASDLTDADWIDQDYLAEQTTVPTGVRVAITGPDNNKYEADLGGPNMGTIDMDHPLTVRNVAASGSMGESEAPDKLFDNNDGTKWCINTNTGWACFELAEPKILAQWDTLHAGAEGASLITSDFRLQVLDTTEVTEAEYLAANEEAKRDYQEEDWNWKDLIVVTGNKANRVSREVEPDKLTKAQVYRFVVDQSIQPDGVSGNAAVRVYGMELYAYTGTEVGMNTNGIILATAAAVGGYRITYTKAGETLASTTFTVTAITAGEHVLEGVPAKEPTCEEPGNTAYWKCSHCDKKFTSKEATEEASDVEIAAIGHKYGETPEWTWTEKDGGGYEAVAVFTCENNNVHKENVNATVEHSDDKSAGKHTYTAAATFGENGYTDTKEVMHEMVEVEGEDATCTEPGVEEHWECTECDKLYTDADHETETTEEDLVIPATGHDLEQVDAKQPTCEREGNIEHWECFECGALFMDSEGTQPADWDDVMIPKVPHTMEKVPAKDPTCTEDGHDEYWTCSVCYGIFEDEDGKWELWDIPEIWALEHDVEFHAEKAPTDTEAGNIEYWHCKRCGKYFSDEACTEEITQEDTVLPAVGHTHAGVYHPAVAPSYDASGNIEYWSCEGCGRLFLDAACTQEAAWAEIVLNRLTPPVNPPVIPPVNPDIPTNPGTTTKPTEPVTPTEPSEPSHPTGDTYTTVETETTGTTATVVLDGSTAEAIIAEASEKNSENIFLTVDAPDEATEAVVTIPAGTMADLTGKTNANLTVKAPAADVTISNTGLASLGASDVAISTKAEGNTVQISITKDGEPVKAVPGGIQAEIPVADAAPGTVAILVDENGNETILKKAVVVDGSMDIPLSGSAMIKIVDNSKTFTDTQAHWASNSIDFVTSRELFQGTSPDTFSADAPMSRAMLVTVLHRLEDTPAAGGVVFADVESVSYYAEAVAWAVGSSIVTGDGNGFNPDGQVTREQLATFLYRYARATGVDVRGNSSLAGFSDSGSVSDWAAEAMQWAVNKGLLVGSNGNLNPAAPATRAEVATILMRFCQMITK